jgi:hypothetical protein
VGIDTERHVADPELASGEPRPGKRWRLALVGLVAVYAVLAAYGVATNASEIGTSASASATAAAQTPGRSVAAPPSRAKHGRSQPTQTSGTASGSAARRLGVASVTAFGPAGASDGDNPAIAYRILDVSTEQPWYSQWYASPSFGGLRTGTGLLLNLGREADVTDVVLTLGEAPGTDVQVRVGDSPSVDLLPTVASAYDAAGTVRLRATPPGKGRYVLIWFIRLSSAGQGHYQVDVYNVSVDGVSS